MWTYLKSLDKSILAQGWTYQSVPTWPTFCSTTASFPRTDTSQTALQRGGTSSSGTASLNHRGSSLSCKGDLTFHARSVWRETSSEMLGKCDSPAIALVFFWHSFFLPNLVFGLLQGYSLREVDRWVGRLVSGQFVTLINFLKGHWWMTMFKKISVNNSQNCQIIPQSMSNFSKLSKTIKIVKNLKNPKQTLKNYQKLRLVTFYPFLGLWEGVCLFGTRWQRTNFL